MTKDELHAALANATGPGDTADAIDAYVRGLVARCRVVSVPDPPEFMLAQRVRVDDEPTRRPGPLIEPESWVRAEVVANTIASEVAKAVEAERAACEDLCRAEAYERGPAISADGCMWCADAIADRKPKAGGK